MAFRINPAKIPVWRDPQTLQIGLEPDAPTFNDLSAQQERFIDLLYRGIADDALDEQANELKVANPHALLERLSPALLESERIRNPKLPQAFLRGAFAEIIRASYRTNRDGLAVLEARANKSVLIDSLDRAGLLIALGLAATGVGRIITSDAARVTQEDCSPIGYQLAAIGSLRSDALNHLISASGGATSVQQLNSLTPAKARSDLAILVATHVLHPARYNSLAGKPHVAVVFSSQSATISPVLQNSPCLGCLEHWRTESNESWPAMAGQLMGRLDYLEDSVSAMHAAASCISLILDELDGVKTENLGASYDVQSKTLTPFTWQAHPACNCG